MPYDSNELVYDYDTHKYYVTKEEVKNRFNIDLSVELGQEQSSGLTEEKVFIKQVSDRVYRWLYWYVRPEMVRITEKRIADNFEPEDYGFPYRQAIEEALYSQIEWMINFDGDLEALDKGEMNKLVSPEVKMILKSSGMATKKRATVKVYADEYRVGY